MGDDCSEWWKAWRDEDYSWHGLVHRHKIAMEDGAIRSLADYWLTAPGGGGMRTFQQLVDNGEIWADHGEEDLSKVFHVAHLPPEFPDGETTWKAKPTDPGWERLREIVAARIKDGMPTPGTPGPRAGSGTPRGPVEDAAVEDGTTEPTTPGPRTVAGRRLREIVAAWIEGGPAPVTPGFRTGGGRLREIVAAWIEGDTTAPATPGPRADGEATERLSWVPNGAEGRAVLDGCVLDGLKLTGTKETPSHVTGRRIAFTGAVDFNSVCLGAGFILKESLFKQGFSARGCSCTGAVLLPGNLHMGPVSLHRSIFEHALYCPDGTYRSSFDASNLQCRHEGNFGGATFHEGATFLNARFNLTATFTGARFEKFAIFDNVIFEERLRFDKVTVNGRFAFTGSTVDKVSTFDNLTLVAERPTDWHSAFDRTTFAGSTDFRRLGVRYVAALDGARIQGGARFDEVAEDDIKNVIADAIKLATKAAHADVVALPPPTGRRDRIKRSRDARNVRLRQLENGCRALKQLSNQSDHRFEATLLTRVELTVRRVRTDVSGPERAVSAIYAATSAYGVSLRRPIAWIIGLVATMTVVFGAFLSGDAWAGGIDDACLDGDKVVAAATLSLGNVFVPFGAWTSKSMPSKFSGMDESWLLLVRLLSTMESLGAVALLFLFGLAIRKRFHVQ